MTAITDLVIVGGGPAGCAAAVMGASVGVRSVLVEADAALCGKLLHIAAVDNVVGGHRSGPELAAAVAGDVARAGLCEVVLGVRVTGVRAYEDRVVATAGNGLTMQARYAVVATGVGPVPAGAAAWLTVAPGTELPTLWGAGAPGTAGDSLLVLGADRPLGTFLRAHPALRADVVVACPPEDDHKADEVRGDARVTLLPVAEMSVSAGGGAFTAEWVDREGRPGSRTAGAVYANLGSAPAAPPGDVVPDASGYCPPERQHPRVLTAGDLRSARFQRIMAATGSGGEAALRAYYALRGVRTDFRRD
jgi:thioredoxin reductase (NADPH)/alkyl hydroperoxide reductase subunit F